MSETYSQSGEDLIINFILKALSIPLEEITYIDLGAFHSQHLSNTYLNYKLGGRGVLVEANPNLITSLHNDRPRDIILNHVVAPQNEESVTFYVLSSSSLSTSSKSVVDTYCKLSPTLKILESYTLLTISLEKIITHYLGTVPTFISIDIEGKELDILKSIDLNHYRPKLFVIETIPYSPFLSVCTKIQEILNYMEQYDYIEYAFTGINSIFIDKRIL